MKKGLRHIGIHLFASMMLMCLGPASSKAQTINATQTDEIIIDNGASGKADPNDRIRYKVTIQNTAGATGAGTKLNIVPDPRTTFAPGTFRSSPLALPDGPYTCIGNVGITVPDGASDLMDNDFDDNTAGLTCTAGTFATTQGGSITIATDGSFSYDPPRGFEGTDTYQYTLNDGNAVAGVTATDLGTVTFTVSGVIWFINNNAGACAANCDGRLSNPFTSLAAFNTANDGMGLNPGDNDLIFVYASATAYTNGITLRSGQKLFGQDLSAPLATAAGLTVPPFSNALPVVNGSTAPEVTITNASGAGITLNSGNTIRGLNVGATSGAKISGNGFGTLTVGDVTAPDVVLSGNGQALNLTTGSFAASSKFISVASTSSTSHGIFLNGVSGTVAMGSTSISGATALGILIQGGSTVNADFGNTTLNGGSGGVSLQSNSGGTRTFGILSITNGSGAAFANILGGGLTNVTGTTTITNPGGRGIDIGNTTAGNGVTFANVTVTSTGSVGVDLNNNAGNITFAALDITPDNGQPALEVTNQTATLTTTSGTISATSASCIDITNAVLAVTLTSVTATGGNIGVGLSQCSGNFTANGGNISSQAVGGFVVSAGTVTVTYSGNFGNGVKAIEINNHDSNNITFQTGTINTNAYVIIQQCNGGAITFSNPTKTFSTGATSAIQLVNNAGATINFTGGGLAITTTSGTGFNALGGGTVNVGTGAANNTITTSAAKAISLDGVLANVNFATISAGSVPTEGINLNNLSASSSFVVPGAVTLGMAAGSNANVNISGCTNCMIDIGTNGTTHNAVNLNSRRASGIILNSVSGTIRFGNVTASNPNSVTVPAIRSTTCAGSIFFAKTDVDMNLAGSNEGFTNAETPQDNNGDGDAIYINNFTGTAFTITGGIIENAGDDGIDIRSSQNLSLTNVTTEDVGKSAGATCVDCNSSGVQGYNLTGTNTITNCSFQRGRLRNFYLSNSTGTSALNITGSTFNDTRISGTPATDNLQVYGTSSASLALDIENATFTRSSTKQIDVVFKGNAQLTKCDITGCTMDYVDGNSAGIFIEGFDNAQVNFNIMNNPKLHSQNENVITIATANTANVQGRIKDNPNMKFNGPSPGGSAFGGIIVLSDGTTSVATVLIENNILEILNSDRGISFSVQGANSAVINATVNANVITATGVTHLEGILAVVNNTPAVNKLICLTINNNQVSGAALARVCRVRALSASGVRITNYVTDLNTTWVNNGNTGAPVLETASGGGTISAAISPCGLPTNPLP